jgi:hypothetical protein
MERGASSALKPLTPKYPIITAMPFNSMNTQIRVPQPPPVPAAVVNPTVVTPAGPHPEEIDKAFASNHELRKRVHAAIGMAYHGHIYESANSETDEHPTQTSLFRDISTFILNQASQPVAEPVAKKRKLEENTIAPKIPTSSNGSLVSSATKAWRSYPGVSFAIPQRKKFTLELLDKDDGGIRAIGASGDVEFSIAWKDVDQVFCLPIPEKAKKQHHFIVIPVHGDGVNPVPEGVQAPEPIIWTFEEATGKNIVEGEDPGPAPMAEAIHHCLIQAKTGKQVVFPDAEEFASATPESHRKGDKAYHVKAHRGSKEGSPK